MWPHNNTKFVRDLNGLLYLYINSITIVVACCCECRHYSSSHRRPLWNTCVVECGVQCIRRRRHCRSRPPSVRQSWQPHPASYELVRQRPYLDEDKGRGKMHGCLIQQIRKILQKGNFVVKKKNIMVCLALFSSLYFYIIIIYVQ